MNAVATLFDQIQSRVALEQYGLLSSGPFSSVMRTPRFRASRHVIWLILPDQKSEPALVAKMPRLCEDRGGVEREAAILRAAHADPRGAAGIIPRVVALEDVQGHLVLLETAMSGQAISPAAVRRDKRAAVGLVTDWLGEFQWARQTSLEEQPGWQQSLMEEPLATLLASGLLGGADTELFQRCGELIAPLRQGGFPLVFEHGDLSHPNLLRTPAGELAVLDWELAAPHGLPGADLFFFLTYAAFALSRAGNVSKQVRAFDAAFFGRNPWTCPDVLRYAGQLHLPAELLTGLFVLCWTRYLAGLIGRLSGDESSPRRVDEQLIQWLRGNRYFALWRHAVTRADQLHWN